jgi:hypothetical protein
MAHSLAMLASPVAALADEASRVSQLESEIQQLRRQIDDQSRRIQRLEDVLGRRSGAAAGAPQPHRSASPATPVQSPATTRQLWHTPDAWNRVAPGMTSVQVAAILGQPTSVDGVDALKTMFYRGMTPDGISLSGIVNLRDDRVVAVNKPAFPVR